MFSVGPRLRLYRISLVSDQLIFTWKKRGISLTLSSPFKCLSHVNGFLRSDAVFNSHDLNVDTPDEELSFDKLLPTVLLSDVVSTANGNLAQGTETSIYHQQQYKVCNQEGKLLVSQKAKLSVEASLMCYRECHFKKTMWVETVSPPSRSLRTIRADRRDGRGCLPSFPPRGAA